MQQIIERNERNRLKTEFTSTGAEQTGIDVVPGKPGTHGILNVNLLSIVTAVNNRLSGNYMLTRHRDWMETFRV